MVWSWFSLGSGLVQGKLAGWFRVRSNWVVRIGKGLHRVCLVLLGFP